MMKELLVIQDELKAILKEGQATVEEYIKEVEVANLAEKQANRDYINAKEEMNVKAYTKASQDKRTAKDIAELYNSKIDEVKDKPFITEDVYKEYNQRIKEEMDRINSTSKTRVIALLQELETIREEVAPAYAKANDLLRELQNNIFKFTYEKQMAEAKERGIPLSSNKLRNEYNDHSLIMAIDFILKSNAVETIKGEGRK